VSEILKAGAGSWVSLRERWVTSTPTSQMIAAWLTRPLARASHRAHGKSHRGSSVQAANRKKKRVYCEEWGKPLITSQPWVAELVAAAGGQFLGEPGRQIPPHDVLENDPEVIIAAWCGAGNRVPLIKIVRERGWAQTTAARNGQVYCISDELLNTPAPTLLQGVHALAAAIHP